MSEFVTNDDGSYMTDLEIAHHLNTSDLISDEDREWIKGHEYHHLISLHSTVGMWIRNTFGLWAEDNPYSNTSNNEQHPDSRSYFVMQMYHKILHGKSPDATNPSLSDITF